MNSSALTTIPSGNVFLLALQWLGGFYLQVVPVAVICIYPFRDHFKCSNKLFYALVASTIVFTSIVWYIAVAREYYFDNGVESDYLGVSDLIFILSLVLLFVVYLIGTKAKVSYKLFIFLLGMSYGFALEITNRTINHFLVGPVQGEFLYSRADIIHYVILNAVFIVPMLKLVETVKECFYSDISPKIWRNLTIILSGVLLFLMFFYELPYATALSPLSTLYIFISALYFFIFILYYWIFIVIREERINVRNREKWKFLAKSYKLEENNLEEIRKVRHELRHHLMAIQLYLKNNDYVGAEEYLDKISGFENELPIQAYSSDNLLNLVLSDYSRKLGEKGITFKPDVSVTNRLKMEDMDLIELFSNLLDNAPEAISQVDNKLIKLTLKQNKNFLTVQCNNTYKHENVIKNGERFVSNKQNSFWKNTGSVST